MSLTTTPYNAFINDNSLQRVINDNSLPRVINDNSLQRVINAIEASNQNACGINVLCSENKI